MIRSLSALLAAISLTTALAVGAPTVIPARPGVPIRVPSASPSAKPSVSPSGLPSGLPSGIPSPIPAPSGAQFDVGVWTVHASSLDANFKNGNFSTPEKIVMTRVGGDISADKANGNYKTKVVYLNGHVVMHDASGNYGGVAGAPAHPSGGPSTLTADKAQIDGTAKVYKAIGNVHYVQNDTTVDADNGTLNDTTHDLFLQGNVHIVQGTHKLDAQSVLYNTISGQAHAQGDVTIQFPGALHRGLATPKPLRVPKNPVSQPVTPASP
jgi:lipopolysaccharide assembly outer membrane protein LptD (OstA)